MTKAEAALQEMHHTHDVLLNERSRNPTPEMKKVVQVHGEAILWLDVHAAKEEARGK